MKIKRIAALLLALTFLFVGCQTTPSQSEDSSEDISIEESSSDIVSIDVSTEDTSSEDVSSEPEEEKDDRYVSVTHSETLIKYPEYPEDALPRNYDYKVRIIQGKKSIEIPVYDPVYASDYFNRAVYNFDQHRRYAEFAFTGEPVTVEITVYKSFSSYTIMPSSKQIPSKISDNVITYTLNEPCTTVLKLNNDKDTHLTIFAEAPETERPITEGKKVVYFEPGYHEEENGMSFYSNKIVYFKAGYHEFENGVVNVGNNSIVYLEPGALVKARLDVNGQNTRVFGRGAFLESSPSRNAVSGTSFMCMLNSSVNVSIEDVRFLDAHTYNIVIDSGIKVNLSGVKLLCNQISTDGLSVWGGGVYGMHMDNCYFNISDNVFVVGGGIQDFFVTNTIIMTDYAVFFPQGKLTGDPIVFKDIDILRFGNFLKHEYPEKPSNKMVNLVIENCCAVDNDRTGGFLKITDTKDAIKSYSLKNVSLPANLSTTLINSDEAAKNATLTFDNVWIGNSPVTAGQLSSRSTLPREGNEIIVTGNNDSSKVCTEPNTVKLSKPVTVRNIYVGDLPIAPKYRPYVQGNDTYVSAYEILEALGFKDIKLSGSKLTFTDMYQSRYELSVSDEKAMVTTKELSKVLQTQISTGADRIQVYNIERRENLLKNPDFEEGLKMPWTTRNFTPIAESNDAHSGNISARVYEYKNGDPDGGIYQDIADILRQQGPGVYEFTAWVKKASSKCTTSNLRMGVVTDWGYDSYSQIKLTNEWQQITFTYSYWGDPNKLVGALFAIGYADGSVRDILIDDVSMIKVG